jgi:hypothetical protein
MLQRAAAAAAKVVRPSCNGRLSMLQSRLWLLPTPGDGDVDGGRICYQVWPVVLQLQATVLPAPDGGAAGDWRAVLQRRTVGCERCFKRRKVGCKRVAGLLLDWVVDAAANHGGVPAVGGGALVSGLPAGRVGGEAGKKRLIQPAMREPFGDGYFFIVRRQGEGEGKRTRVDCRTRRFGAFDPPKDYQHDP